MTERRKWFNVLASVLVYAAAGLTLLLLAVIIGFILIKGLPEVNWSLLTSVPSVIRNVRGILPYIVNTLLVVLLSMAIVLPLGVCAAVYLNEYAKNRRLISAIEYTIETLAGIPSIIYGLVGVLVFNQKLGLGGCLISGSLTLVVMTLPTIIRTTQESLKTVHQSYREGALGLGAARWHIVRTLVLPCSLDGIVSGCILAIGRIVGESAALLFTAGTGKVLANSLIRAYTSSGATLSVALYMAVSEEGDFATGYAIATVLMVLVLVLNLLARLAQTKLKREM
ncbi:MAG: phosphate ABC transporter permease PstA [Oscillospiraceae bacterium]|nr:phosphate ABC transporter permease PstA [Oscillospiraceae bacterium]